MSFIIQFVVVYILSFVKGDASQVAFVAYFAVFLTAAISAKTYRAFIACLLIGLLLLDYDVYFAFGDQRLRVWYLFVIVFIPFCLLLKRLRPIHLFYAFIAIYLALIALIFGGALDFAKYLLYVFALVVLTWMYRERWYSISGIFPIMMIPIYFSIAQMFLYITSGLDSFLWDVPRVSAYFSESTWMGAYSVLMISYLYYLKSSKTIKVGVVYLNMLLAALILVISGSFNALLGMLVVSSYLFIALKSGRIFVVIFISLFVLVAWDILGSRIEGLDTDLSFLGRLLGFELLLDSLRDTSIFGSGFSFNYDVQMTDSGAALGAKAFSFPFQIYAIGGLPFLLAYLYLISASIYSDARNGRGIGVVLLITFAILSTFAPLAQGVVGLMFIWMRMCIKIDSSFEKSA